VLKLIASFTRELIIRTLTANDSASLLWYDKWELWSLLTIVTLFTSRFDYSRCESTWRSFFRRGILSFLRHSNLKARDYYSRWSCRFYVHCLTLVAGRVGGPGVENSRRFAGPRENAVGSEGKVPDEGRVRSGVEAEAEKKGQRPAEENTREVSIFCPPAVTSPRMMRKRPRMMRKRPRTRAWRHFPRLGVTRAPRRMLRADIEIAALSRRFSPSRLFVSLASRILRERARRRFAARSRYISSSQRRVIAATACVHLIKTSPHAAIKSRNRTL